MQVPPLLDALLRAPGPTGFEEPVSAIVREAARATGAAVEADVLGTTVARVAGSAGGRLIALVAHVDQVGMIVRDAGDDGLLRVAKLSNWGASSAVGQRVRLVTANGLVPGVVIRDGDGDAKWGQIRVDVGAATRDEAIALVPAGSPAVLDAPPVELAGDRIASGAIDDRAGVYAGLTALAGLAAEPPAWDVAFVASVLEEGPSAGGASAAAARLAPDIAFVLEVSFAGGVPGQEAWGRVELGGGPIVYKGPVAHNPLADRLLAVAAEHGIPVQIEAGDSTWSDADNTFNAAGGVAALLVSVPLRYMHTGVEVAALADIDALVSLVTAFVRSLPIDLDLTR